MKSTSILLTLLLPLFLCTGCGSNKVPLRGKVTFADDGTPLPHGIVCFETDGFLARGVLKPDGTYRISSTGRDDGLPPGKYKIYLVKAESMAEGKGGNFVYTPLVDKRYESAETTDLECEVDGSTRRFDFEVERIEKNEKPI